MKTSMTTVLLLSCFVTNLCFAQTFEKGIANAIIEQTNNYRTENGREKLRYNPKLEWAADLLAREMARVDDGTWAHDADGRDGSQRLNHVHYDWAGWGENIFGVWEMSSDQAEADYLFNGWVNSTLHRNNMLNAGYQEIGVSVFRGNSGTVYAVQLFARPWEFKNTADVNLRNYSLFPIYVYDDMGYCDHVWPYQTKTVRLRSSSFNKVPTMLVHNGGFAMSNQMADGSGAYIVPFSYDFNSPYAYYFYLMPSYK